MAHIYDLAGQITPTPSYTAGTKTGTQVIYPSTQVFQGFNAPSRIEGDIYTLEFSGTIPADINGTFYRVQPDHRFPPIFEDDIHFNGDGSVTAIRIQNGNADFKQRYVRTDRYKAETEARRALFGRYRNPYTDNETVKGVIRTAANTNVTFWRGVLLASKEDGPPFIMVSVCSFSKTGQVDGGRSSAVFFFINFLAQCCSFVLWSGSIFTSTNPVFRTLWGEQLLI
jgi:carotenoid cleavage dioxygenase